MRLGLRQLDLANALRVSAQAVSKWERGENAPDLALLPKLARLLDLSLDTLLSEGPSSGSFEATVLCTGVCGFAKRAESLAAPQVAAWVNGIFVTLTETVLRHNGVPVKYVGDGFLTFFAGQAHALRARQAFVDAHKLLAAQGLVGVLSTGEVYLGSVGHPDYAKSDVIGETVNRAFLLLQWTLDSGHAGLWVTDDDSPAAGWMRIGTPEAPRVPSELRVWAYG
jgi:class 3 adenylate cyclase